MLPLLQLIRSNQYRLLQQETIPSAGRNAHRGLFSLPRPSSSSSGFEVEVSKQFSSFFISFFLSAEDKRVRRKRRRRKTFFSLLVLTIVLGTEKNAWSWWIFERGWGDAFATSWGGKIMHLPHQALSTRVQSEEICVNKLVHQNNDNMIDDLSLSNQDHIFLWLKLMFMIW